MKRVIDLMRRRLDVGRSADRRTRSADPAPGLERADRILNLRADVSRLQQLRLAHSDGSTPGESAASGMASIERDLAEAQRELAKLQARI